MKKSVSQNDKSISESTNEESVKSINVYNVTN